MRYERIHANHISRERDDRQVVINLLQNDYHRNRHQLTAAQCASREVIIQQTISHQNAQTNALNAEEHVAIDRRSNDEYVLTQLLERRNEIRVCSAVEECLLTHTQRLNTHSLEANSLRDHMIQKRLAR